MMILSTGVTIASPSFTSFFVTTLLARFLHAFGWAATIKIIGNWWPKSLRGRVMGLAGMSCCLGDASPRILLGSSLYFLNWKGMYGLAMGFSLLSTSGCLLYVKDAPETIPMDTRPVSKSNSNPKSSNPSPSLSYSSSRDSMDSADTLVDGSFFFKDPPSPLQSSPSPPKDSPFPSSLTSFSTTFISFKSSLLQFSRFVLVPLLVSPRFYCLLITSFCLTIIREVCYTFLALFFAKFGLETSLAGVISSIFSIVGALSAVLGGTILDKVPQRWKGMIGSCFGLGLCASLASLYIFCQMKEMRSILLESQNVSSSSPQIFLGISALLIGFVALTLNAPLSFTDGYYAMGLVNSHGSAFASCTVGMSGFLGAFLFIQRIGQVIQLDEFGWERVWGITLALAGVATLSSLVFSLLSWQEERKRSKWIN